VEASRGNWDMIESGSDVFTVIDFSYLSPNIDNILKIKEIKIIHGTDYYQETTTEISGIY
jgi:hypothetical protein